MKWIVLAGLLGAIPFFANWFRGNPRQAPWLSGLLGFLLFAYAPWHLSVAPLPWPYWAGYVKGIEITVIDCIALAILLGGGAPRYSKPFKWQMALYLCVVVFTTLQCAVPMAASFYIWQILRMYLVFLAVARIAPNERHWKAIITGMIFGVAYQTLEAARAAAHGAIQSGGTLGHQNLLGMLTNLLLMPIIGILLSGVRFKWAAFGAGASALALVLTASRASLVIGGVGAATVILLALVRSSSPRKTRMAMTAILALVMATPLAISRLSSRFQGTGISMSLDKEDVRLQMEHAAKLMIADHPFGVGPNYFNVSANKDLYWKRAGVVMTVGNLGAQVHNSYLLVEAETGFLGLAVIILILISGVIYPLRIAFRYRRLVHGDVLIGLGVSVACFAVHNRVEWGVVSENIQYVLVTILGLISGLAAILKRAAFRGKPRNAAPPGLRSGGNEHVPRDLRPAATTQ